MEIIKVKEKKDLELERNKYEKLEIITNDAFTCSTCGQRYEFCTCGN